MRYVQTSYRADTSYKLTITSTGAQRTSAMSVNEPVFSIANTVNCWYKCGSSTVTATSTGNQSHFIPAGRFHLANKGENDRYVSVIADTTSGFAVVTGETL